MLKKGQQSNLFDIGNIPCREKKLKSISLYIIKKYGENIGKAYLINESISKQTHRAH